MWQTNSDEEEPRLGPPIAWAIGVAAIMSVFAVVIIIVNYVPLNRQSELRVETALTPATYETVAALVRATGNSCPQVCAVTAAKSLTATTTLDVECASHTAAACKAPLHYHIHVLAEGGPQR